MMGMVSLAKNAPTLIANPYKREIYAAESYMTRETRERAPISSLSMTTTTCERLPKSKCQPLPDCRLKGILAF